MSTNGPGAVGGSGSTPGAGAQPAMPGCHGPRAGAQQVRTVVIGGGASYSHALGAPSPDRLAEATRRACPANAGHRPLPSAGRPVDPALVALGTLLAQATPPPSQQTAAQRLTGQLTLLIQATSARLAALLGSGAAVRGGGPDAATADARPLADAPAAQPLVAALRAPLQPPPPSLTLDPTLGTIVDDGDGRVPLGSTGHAGGSDSSRGPLFPSSWVPVTGILGRLGTGGRDGALRLLGHVDRLLDRSGMTRGQLLLLMLLAPPAVVFLIDVAQSMLDGR